MSGHLELVPILTFIGGVSIAGLGWMVKGIFDNKSVHLVVSQKLDDHLHVCDERYTRIDEHLNNIDDKIDESTAKTFETAGKIDTLISEVRKNGH